MKYTREELVELCRKGRVLYNKWGDRDSHSSQESLMMSHLLLESGCKFRVMTEENTKEGDSCITDEETIWIEIFFDDWESGEDWHGFYIPTQKRLDDNKGGDWY